MVDSLWTLNGVSLFVLGYHWLPLATIDLVGDNREFEVLGIFWPVIPVIFWPVIPIIDVW